MENEKAIVEAILFAKGEPVLIKNIAIALNKTEKQTKVIIDELIKEYEEQERGIKIIKIENSYQMCTNPKYFSDIKQLYSLPQKKAISQTLLETLAIIAYKQPITKSQIEYIRGVSCEHAINSLIKHELVEETGRLDAIGRPILFGTSENFLKHFGFTSLEQMPKLEEDEDIKIQIENDLFK